MGTNVQVEQHRDFSFRKFGGVNTRDQRWAIEEDQFAWLENVIPIGAGNLAVVPATSGALAGLTGGLTCTYLYGANIGGVEYQFMFASDGSLWQINTATNPFTKTSIAAANTFTVSGVVADQWNNTTILIMDSAKGMFSWDGATLLNRSTPFAITASILPATFSITASIAGAGGVAGTILTVTAAAGYLSNGSGIAGAGVTTGTYIVLQISGSLGGVGTYVVNASQLVASVAMTVTPNIPSSTMTVTITAGYLTVGTVISGAGVAVGSYIQSQLTGTTGSTGTYILSTYQTVGSVAMTATPSVPSAGTAIKVFSGRVWIGNKRTVSFSAPGSYTDFIVNDAAGQFVTNDSSLRSNVTTIQAANNYLYIFGTTSINVISDVRVSTGVTLFSNTNISTAAGTAYPLSVVPYFRTIFFTNSTGIFGLTGSTPKVMSDDIDNTIALIDFTQPITTALASIYEKLCLLVMFTYNDPLLGGRKLIAGYLDKKWFFITPPTGALYLTQGYVNSAPVAYVTDGTSLFQMFYTTLLNTPHTIKTKLFDMGAPLIDKKALKFGLERITSASLSTINFSIDTETGTVNSSFTGIGGMLWLNSNGAQITWNNSVGQNMYWSAAGYIFAKQNVENSGSSSIKYLGATINTSTQGGVYSGFHFQFDTRASW